MKFTVTSNSQFPDIKEYSVKNAHIGCFGYITKGLENLAAIMPPDYSKLRLKSIAGNYLIRKTVKVDTAALSVVNSWYSNFYHFIYESLIKIYCLRNHLPDTPIVFPAAKQKFHNEWIDLLDLKNMLYIGERQVVKTPLAISCNHLSDDIKQKDQILLGFREWVITTMKKKGLIGDKSKYPRKIFITRRNPRYRKIINSNEVLPLVEKNGYAIIELEDYNLAQQINYFYHAEDIVGVHGAGFAHIGFTKAPVLDIIVDNFYSDWFLKLSNSLGNHYEFMRTKGVENDYHRKTPGYHDMIIDITLLKEHIARRNSIKQSVVT